MKKILLGFFILSTILFSGDLAKDEEEFMQMCNNPTPSQKITFEAIAKYKSIKLDKDMCAYLYAKTGSKYFSADADIYDVTDLSPLKFFLSLTSLSLPRSKVKDISVLKYLTKLKDLNLSGNPVSDLSALKDLKYLEDLDIYSTQVSNLSPLNNIKTLKRLSYSGEKSNNIIDIKQIKDLTNLEYLGILFAKTENFCLINNFTKLTHFNPDDSVTSKEMTCLKNLKELKNLDLSDDKFITNIDFVVNFPKLSSLSIDNTNVKNIDILKNVQTLKYLNIINTKVTDASVITGRQDFVLSSYYAIFFNSPFTRFDAAPLKWCSPKNTQDIRDGKSCYEKDGTLKPLYKRWLGL